MTETPGDGGQDRALHASWLTSLWPTLLIGGVTLAIALAFGSTVRDREKRALEIATATAHEAVVSEVENRVLEQVRALERLAANWERRGGLSRSEFEVEAGEFAQDTSFLQAVEWVAPDFHVRWVVPRSGNEAVQDLDLGFEARRSNALEASRDERVVMISRPIELVQGGLGFAVDVPLAVGGHFDGFIYGVYRTDDLFSELLRNVATGFGVRIADDGEVIYERDCSGAEWPLAHVSQVRGSPRPWSVEVAPRSDVIAIYQTKLPLLVAVSGAAVALGFAIAVHVARSRRYRNRQLSAEIRRRMYAERELSKVVRGYPDHVWSGEVTPEGFQTLYYSPVLAQITGTPPDTYRDSPEAWYETVHEADVEALKSATVEVLNGALDAFEMEYRIYRGDGTIGWVRQRVRATPTKHGRRIDGVTSDITETKRAETERLRNEKQKLLLLERERMVREMHDGLGGQLVSTLAMVERGRGTQREIAEALRSALDDMRIAIDSLDPTTTDLTTSLGKLRARLEPLLRRNGVVLRWQVEDAPGLDDYPPDETLHLLRIIQESVTNAMRHAKAGEVSVRIHAGDEHGDVLSIEIRDDGCGFRPEAAYEGRGIHHMKARAAQLGGELRFDCDESGTRIELRVAIPH